MSYLRRAVREVLPTGQEWTLFGCLWLKLLIFFTLVFNAERAQFSLAPLNTEIFRSALRPLYFSLILLLVVAAVTALPPRWRGKGHVVASLLLSALLLADLWYFRAFRIFPSVRVLGSWGHLELTPDLVVPFLRWVDLTLFLDLVLLKALGGFRFSDHTPGGPRRLALQTATFALLLALVGPVGAGALRSQAASEPVDLSDSVAATVKLSPLGYHALDFAAFLRDGGRTFMPLSAEDRQRIGAWLEANRELLPPGSDHGRLAGRNLLVIQVESLEYFVLDQNVDGQEITPVLNALKRQGLSFSQFHEQVNQGTSSDADLMTNASVYPVRGVPTFATYPTATLPSLPRILAGRGYRSTSMHPDHGSVWNCHQGLVNLGFDTCLDSAAFDDRDRFGIGLSDASYLAQAAPMVAAQQGPFYTFLVTQSSHMPFDLPGPLRELKLEPALDRHVMGDYLQSVHYTDKHLGLFLDRLRQAGILEHTIVVVTGDHQGIHKYYGQQLRQSPLAQPWWRDEGRRLPLLIVAKGLAPRDIATHGGQVDLMPTLLDLLGIDPGPEGRGMMGRSLVNTRRDHCLLADGTVLGHPAGACAEGLHIADLLIRGNYLAEPEVRTAKR